MSNSYDCRRCNTWLKAHARSIRVCTHKGTHVHGCLYSASVRPRIAQRKFSIWKCADPEQSTATHRRCAVRRRKTGAKTDEVLTDPLWPCRSKGGCAGVLGPLDVICPEDVEIDGGDNIASRCCGLCGTTSNKFMNKATEK